MALVWIARHNERINTVLDVPPPPRPKSPMYVSEREKALKRQKIMPTHKDMGFVDIPLRSTNCYMHKGGGITVPIKKAIPDSDEYTNVKKTKKTPIKRSKKAPTKKEKPLLCVDSPRGHKSKVSTFTWVKKRAYGKVPAYLIKKKREIQKAEEDYRKELESIVPMCRLVSPRERQALLEGLDHNRAEVAKEFLLMPLVIDTVPKVLRKVSLENRVSQLEREVALVERNPYIYVYD